MWAILTQEAYDKDVQNVVMFLEGKENAIIDNLVNRMEQMAARESNFEAAATIRDQITQLRTVQENKQFIVDKGNVDVIGWRIYIMAIFVYIYYMFVMGKCLIVKLFSQNKQERAKRANYYADF